MPVAKPIKPVDNKTVLEVALKYQEKQNLKQRRDEAIKKQSAQRAMFESASFMEAASRHDAVQHKFAMFSEDVKLKMLGSLVSDIGKRAMTEANRILERGLFDESDMNTFGAITYSFIKENGEASTILYNMTKGPTTFYLSEVANMVKKYHRNLIEAIDRSDPNAFAMEPGYLADFEKTAAETAGHDELVQSIADRVAETITDFVEKNTEDKQKILGALNATKDKVESLKNPSEELKQEYYNMGRQYITKIREGKHGLFNEMVVTLSKSIMKGDNTTLKEQYMDGAHINMERVMKSIATMYTFIETVNTMRLAKVDEAFINDVLKSISE